MEPNNGKGIVSDMSSSLESRAYQELRRRIISAEYLPGALLSENDLAEQLQMSRTPIRAAINLLMTEGFVESLRGRGVLVKDISFREYGEMLETFISLQIYALDTIGRRALPLDLEALGKYLVKSEEAMVTMDIPAYYDNSFSFGETIVGAIHNDHMMKVLSQIRGKYMFKMVSFRKMYPQYKPHKSQESNRLIYEALSRGDLATAKSAVLEIYTSSYEQMKLRGMM
ncbi:GntR family transcriptional regulator [Cohnella fermenti]|uniref:GntR family transcriptional regulator n=1 Tax=Cohnella fermenti TaxID=2565925 RepID=A0A4V3WE38_9BACL|nr:GntR family transcriptional regulator [Cohnella fermenti]THF74719.1 GntR family transcriptional regulator [Cohnella fermenti]